MTDATTHPLRRHIVALLGALPLGLSTPSVAAPRREEELLPYGAREDVMRFADEVAQRQGFDPTWTRDALSRARQVPAVQRLIMPPPAGTAKNWAAYRSRFVEPVRIRAGMAFWDEHERWLQRAEERWGVPASIVVGIVGVETIYGRHTGSFRVLDALATLSFDFPSGRRDRTPFFRSELEAFLQYCQREALDPTEPLGSYAGAMGLPQFMPSSILRYGIDFDEDGHVDLHRNPADVIG
ncbi:MAG: lytic transglycosylase domain-containing protein, partial [Piscinibacter sp.]